jgi:Zn-dependent protease with chaperone function
LTLPLPFLVALLLAFADRELWRSLPGSGSLARLALFMPLLLLPSLLALAAGRGARRQLLTAVANRVPPRALLRLSAVASPLCVHLFFTAGRFDDCIERLAWNSHLGRLLLTVLPVFLAELPRLWLGTLAGALGDIDSDVAQRRVVLPAELPGPDDVAATVRLRFGWPLLLAMPLVLFGAGLDLLQWHRDLYVFVLATSPGMTLGSLVFLIVALLLLPRWFCIAFGARPDLPEPLGARLRHVAAELGFPRHGVMLLPTGMRALNAMMVGPLPLSRRLCITDGLCSALDADALAGVVAHEVGHSTRAHPALLMTLAICLPVPFLLLLREAAAAEWALPLQAAIGLGLAAALWLLLRSTAHRFEHEADAASVTALGAGPCSHALLSVARQAMPMPDTRLQRLFSLHPTEVERLRHMRSYEGDPAYRAHFEQRGRQLRRGVLMVVAATLALAAWSWSQDWPFERTIWQLYRGDPAAARADAAALATTATMPEHWRDVWTDLAAEVDIAWQLAPTAHDWPTAKPAFAAAWPRGEQTLLASGPAAARPWFALALAAIDDPTPVQRAIHAYCAAAADNDPERLEQLRQLIHELGPPPALEPVFRGT